MPDKTLKDKVEGFRDLLNGENCDFGRCACCNEKAVVYCNDSKAWVCGLHFTQEGDYKEYLILLTNFTALQEKGKEALTALEEELQRARDALRWIPCEERLPEKSGNYRTTESIQPMGAEGFLYLLNFSYFDKTTKQWKGRGKIVAWMERPSPYTPEEK